MELPLHAADGAKSGTVKVDDKLFGSIIRRRLLHDIVVWYESNLHRRRTASTKTRSEVHGSRKKPWKQKHTGRARVGTRMSPIWRHGGVVFGPGPRFVDIRIPQGMRQSALDSALLGKMKDGEAVVWERPALEAPKTATVAKAMAKIGRDGSKLVVVGKTERAFSLSCRNLVGTKVVPAESLNAYDVLKHRSLVFVRDGFDRLIELRKKPKAAKASAAV